MYQNPTDTRTMIPFLNLIQETYGHLPEYIVADAGYGSEPNYMAIIDDFNRIPLITYGMFIKDKTKNIKATSLTLKIGIMTKLTMNIFVQTISDCFKRYAYRHDKYGFKRDFKLYECDDCSECPLKHQCMKYNSKQIKNNEKL